MEHGAKSREHSQPHYMYVVDLPYVRAAPGPCRRAAPVRCTATGRSGASTRTASASWREDGVPRRERRQQRASGAILTAALQ